MQVGVHLSFMASETANLRLRATRRDEPDLGKLIEWALGIAEARHRAWVAGEPDPYGLPPPDGLAESSSALRFVRNARGNQGKASLPQRRPTISTAITADATVLTDAGSATPRLLAVSYLRVSTREQAERGGTEEGFSIPAQREANARKAAELGTKVMREFIDAGESARSADRDGLKDMLAFITATRVTLCIVHKLDRLARNRADDVKIHEALLAAGVTLVSATESIDQTPSGMLVHGIMSSIAEFYSRNLATEVTKG